MAGLTFKYQPMQFNMLTKQKKKEHNYLNRPRKIIRKLFIIKDLRALGVEESWHRYGNCVTDCTVPWHSIPIVHHHRTIIQSYHSDWAIIDKFSKIEEVGEGIYGVIRKGKTTNQVVTMKKIRLESKEEVFPCCTRRFIFRNTVTLNIVHLQMWLYRNPGYISSLEFWTLSLQVSSWVLHLLRVICTTSYTKDYVLSA